MGGHQPARLVKHEQPGALARRQRLAVDRDDIVGGDIERRRIDHAAVDRDAALHDPFLGVAARGEACPRHHLGDALAGFLFARRPRRTPLVRLALAVLAAAAERRTFYEDLAVVFVVAAGPIGRSIRGSCIAARMFLPGTPPFTWTIKLRPLTKRPITLGTILARARKTRALIAAAVLTRFVVTRLVEARLVKASLVKISGALTWRTRIASGMVRRTGVALLPRFGFTSIPPVALAIRRAAREFLVAAKFSLRTIAARSVAVLAKAFAARRVGSLLTAAFPRCIRFLVAEFLFGKSRGGPSIATVGTRRAVVAIVIRADATRGVGALFGTVAARTIIPVEALRTRRVAIITARSVSIAARRRAFAFAGIGFARARIGLLAIGFGAVGLVGGRLAGIRLAGVGPLL